MSSSVVPPEQPLVLREQLPLPRPYVAPSTPTEQRLAEIWRTALSMDRVGVEDRYNDLGGDSFLATAIFNTIEQTFRVGIPMAVLAEAPTITALALRIDGLLLDGPHLDGRTQHRSF
jgi:acyl carrier protein